jgi:HEAT repeat protein
MNTLSLILALNLPFSKESVQSGIESDPTLIFIWFLIIFFIIATVVILSATILIRKKKNSDLEKTNTLNERYHQFLSELASGNYTDKALEIMSADKETTLALNKEDFTKPFNRKTLLKELLSLQKDLAGEAAYKLREVYLTLGYKEESLKKLKSLDWMKRVEGIQELKQMDIKDGYQPLFKLVNDRNQLVRLEAILARMKMDVNPLSLFEELEDDLTDWEQLRIHNLLHRLPLQDIPSFLPLLDHKLTTVQLFGVKMVALFNQAETESLLIKKLGNTATKLNLHIVESLADIGSEKSVQKLHEIFEFAEEKLKVKIINTLYQIAGESDAQFFTNQLSIENYDIKLAAAKAIVKLQEKGDSVNVEELELVPVETQNIIDHARQWRNQ